MSDIQNDSNLDYDLNIDDLAPKPKRIKMGESIIEVQPPSIELVMRVGSLSKELESSNTDGKVDLDKMAPVITNINKVVVEAIPELEGVKLNLNQLTSLLTLVIEMGMPKDNKELAKRGITVDSQKKAE